MARAVGNIIGIRAHARWNQASLILVMPMAKGIFILFGIKIDDFKSSKKKSCDTRRVAIEPPPLVS